MKSYDELVEENYRLREEVAVYRNSRKTTHLRKDAARLFGREKRRDLYERANYLSFLKASFRSSFVYGLYRRLYRVFRPTFIVVRLFRWFLLFLTMLQASVVLLTVMLASLILLPLFLLLLLVISFRILYERRLLRPKMKEAFLNKKVLVFFSSGKNGQFFDRNMETLLSRYTVIVVQENGSLLQRAQIDRDGRKRRFLTATRMTAGYYRIRPHYYFYLRKHYFKGTESVSVIY